MKRVRRYKNRITGKKRYARNSQQRVVSKKRRLKGRARRIKYNTADPIFEARLKAMKEVGKRIKKSPAYGLKLLIKAGILDKNGNFTPRYRDDNE